MARMLVVDDQRGVRTLLQLAFQEEGYQVATAVNGRDALRQVERWRPDVVLMDVRMPVMGGLETLPRIKTIAPQTAVIIMSAYVEVEAVDEIRRMGADDFIYKPFDLEELKAKVKAVLPEEVFDGRKAVR
ncbi:Sporulation initiation phosphotransferase F [Moorella humiferrea]|uniref:Stage 0 sporulation protein A homolog n=2 Tax=Neomoorella humiferrea TaxID=676965 RepID=A0A2T0AJZ1_9FIRM|nr:Sporulation initiation phosphotransferase F [Moorella humiferrea]